MVKQNLVNYLSEGLKRGFDISLLKSKLLEANFNKQDIEDASNYILNNKNPPAPSSMPSPQSSLSLFQKIRKAFSQPSNLFQLTQDEKIMPALKYQALLLLVPLIIFSVVAFLLLDTLVGIMTSSLIGVAPELAIVSPLLSNLLSISIIPIIGIIAIFTILVVPLLTFFAVLISHLFVKLYRGTGKYRDTYKALIYSSTPSILFGWIPVIGLAASLWSFILAIIGISLNHKISGLRAFLALITPLLIIIVIVVILFFTGIM